MLFGILQLPNMPDVKRLPSRTFHRRLPSAQSEPAEQFTREARGEAGHLPRRAVPGGTARRHDVGMGGPGGAAD